MTDGQAPGTAMVPGAAPVPQGGVFALSEVLPLIQRAAADLDRKRQAWVDTREAKDRAKAKARKTRADLIVTLRVWGNDGTAGEAIKTSAERNEWADADADVQRAELDSDLAQTLAMTAYEAYQDAQASFNLLSGYLGMERDSLKAERHGG